MTTATPEKAPHEARTPSPKVTLAMLICGIFAAVAAGAATPDADAAPSIKVKYDPAMLETDKGAHKLYVRLETAATEVCPASLDPHLVSHEVAACREHAVQQAVMQINNPRLVALYQSSPHIG